MELSPARQKLLFVVIVVALATLGYFLVLPGLRHHAAATVATTAPPTSAPAPAVTAAPVATQSAYANIYNWLPFTAQDLADAASVTTQFSVDYETYTYTESANVYIGRMSDLITSELAATLQNAYATPGVAALRTGQQQISSGTAQIVSLRAFGPSSLTFVVSISQRLVSSGVTSSVTKQYAVTLTGAGASWQVNDIELASDGNT
jgi:hypothetical protein